MWLDEWFANDMVRLVKLAHEHYERMRFKDALKVAFYGMMEARDRYRTGCSGAGVLESLVDRGHDVRLVVGRDDGTTTTRSTVRTPDRGSGRP